MKPVFWIFSQYQTGSKLFCSLLNSHPDICCWHEALLPRRGKVRYWWPTVERMSKIAPCVGLHGHVNWLLDDVHLVTDFPVILLTREDEIAGAIKQIMLDYNRPDQQFRMESSFVQDALKLRRAHNDKLRLVADIEISFEEITAGLNDTESLYSTDALGPVLDLIGVERRILYAGTDRQRQKMPANTKEIRYALAS